MRTYHLAKFLASDAQVTLVQLTSGPDQDSPPDKTAFERVISIRLDSGYTPGAVLKGMLGPMPVTLLKYSSEVARRSLTEILRDGQFDSVQLESVHLLTYLEAIRSDRSKPAIVADWHNIESELMWRYAANARNPATKLVAKRTAELIKRAENRFLAACDRHVVVSEPERDALLARFPSAAIDVVPNGVDAAAFPAQSSPGGSAMNKILFVGSMDYHANIDGVLWFSKTAWPTIAERHPELKFLVVGRNPPASVRQLASNTVIVTGSVPDVRPFYQDALAAVVPLRVGGGTRLKILEAMAAGVPVVSTKLGAEGIEAEPGKHFLLADTSEQLSSSILHLVNNAGLGSQLASAGRVLVDSRYDWSLLGAKLLGIHCSALQ